MADGETIGLGMAGALLERNEKGYTICRYFIDSAVRAVVRQFVVHGVQKTIERPCRVINRRQRARAFPGGKERLRRARRPVLELPRLDGALSYAAGFEVTRGRRYDVL